MTYEPQALLELITRSLTNRDLDEAQRHFSDLRKTLGSHPIIPFIAGQIAFHRNDHHDALRLLEQARIDFPQNPDLLLMLADLYLKTGAIEDCINVSTRAWNARLRTEQIVFAAYHLCAAFRLLGRVDQAAAAINSLIARLAATGETLLSVATKYGQIQLIVSTVLSVDDFAQAKQLFASYHAIPKRPIGHLAVSNVVSVHAWCRKRNIAVMDVDRPVSVSINNRSGGSGSWYYETDGYFVAQIPEGEMLAGWDFVVTPNGEVLGDSGYTDIDVSFKRSPHSHCSASARVLHQWPEEVSQISSNVLFLSAPAEFHIGHWLLDFLPRLRALELGPFSQLKVAIPANLPQKHRDLLACCGIGGDRLISCDFGRRYRFSNLIVAMPGDYTRPSPANFQFVYNALAPREMQSGLRLFLDRGVGTRRLVNAADVDAVLSEFGFRSVCLKKMSVPQQRELLAGAEIVVGVFGSDLLAILFAPRGCTLVELIWDEVQDPIIGPLCHFIGIKHRFLVGRKVDIPSVKQYKKDQDFHVDCHALRECLRAALVDLPLTH